MARINYRAYLGIILVAVTVIVTPARSEPDYAREKRWANEVVPGLIVGDAIYLKQANGHAFLGILAEAENAPVAVIIVHGMGIHPDWGLIGNLRQRLFDEGYTTLSVQMPVLAADAGHEAYPAIFPDAVERLTSTVAYLQQKSYSAIALVSHSNGSRMSRMYMATNPPAVTAWAALSLTRGDTFQGITLPILDLYGGDDLTHVLAGTAKRKASLAHPTSRQEVIAGADHFFTGHEDAMVEAVKTFLDEITHRPTAR